MDRGERGRGAARADLRPTEMEAELLPSVLHLLTWKGVLPVITIMMASPWKYAATAGPRFQVLKSSISNMCVTAP